jgi:hypothetical protein
LRERVELSKGWRQLLQGRVPLKGWSKYKRQLDRKMLAALERQAGHPVELKPWQHRDLRRTARSLMARIGSSGEVAELFPRRF